jgi:hypothetical protein
MCSDYTTLVCIYANDTPEACKFCRNLTFAGFSTVVGCGQTRVIMQENLLRIWSEFGTTIVFVTHDIEEAIYLADRVLVMSASPGQILREINTSLPRPRSLDLLLQPEFLLIKKECFELIKQQSQIAFEQMGSLLGQKRRWPNTWKMTGSFVINPANA